MFTLAQCEFVGSNWFVKLPRVASVKRELKSVNEALVWLLTEKYKEE